MRLDGLIIGLERKPNLAKSVRTRASVGVRTVDAEEQVRLRRPGVRACVVRLALQGAPKRCQRRLSIPDSVLTQMKETLEVCLFGGWIQRPSG